MLYVGWLSMCACKSLDVHHLNHFDSNNYNLHFASANPLTISHFLIFSEKGFINLTPASNRTIQVRSGESFPLNVDMEAYPKPHTFSWSFMGHELRNTTDHVITTQNHEYRWENTLASSAPVFPHRWKCLSHRLVEFNTFWFGCRSVEVLMQQLHLSQLPEKYSWNSKNAQGLILKRELSEYKWLSQEKKAWNISSITSVPQIDSIQGCMFILIPFSSRFMVFVFNIAIMTFKPVLDSLKQTVHEGAQSLYTILKINKSI